MTFGMLAVSRTPMADVRQIAASDRRIDLLVCRREGLTEGEVEIAERGTG